MKKLSICILFMIAVVSATVFGKDIVKIEKNYITIAGFDFSAGTFDTALDAKADDVYTKIGLVPNQVIVGHSQGGLTGLGYIKKEKAYAILQNRASNVSAFISVDSPVRGFAGLDSGYANMRNNLLDEIDVHTRAFDSTLTVIPATMFLGTVLSLVPTTTKLNFIMLFTGEMECKTLINTLINNKSGNTTKIREITDMGKSSDYVCANVGSMKVTSWVKYQSGTRYYWVVKYKKINKWLKIAYLERESEPVYSYYPQLQYVFNYRNDIPIGHVVGTDNDPLRMAKGAEDNLRIIKNCIGVGYGIAGALHSARAIATWPFGYSYYKHHADNCFKGVKAINNYESRWGNVIGGNNSDAFITEDSQVLPGTPEKLIKRLEIDHARSTDDDRIWGTGGKIHQIKLLMNLGWK